MAFPAVSLLDSFIRAAESPLSNKGRWITLNGNTNRGVVTGESWGSGDPFPTEDNAWWQVEEFSGEVAAALEYHSGLSLERYGRLWVCLQHPFDAARSGYSLKVLFEAAGKVKLILQKSVEGTLSTLGEKAAVALAEGDRVGLSVVSGVVRVWRKTGAGAWEEVLSKEDAAYSQGYAGVGGAGNLHRWRNFEAGGTVTKTNNLATTGQKQTAKLAHSITRALTVSQAQTATETSGRGKEFSTTQTQAATLVRTPERTLPTIKAKQTPKLSRTILRTLSATQASVATQRAVRSPSLSTTQGSSATKAVALARTLVRAQASKARWLRDQEHVTLTTSTGQVALVRHEAITEAESEEEALKRTFPYPQVFMNGPGLIDSYQSGTPAWERDPSDPFHARDFKPYVHYNEWDDGPQIIGEGELASLEPVHVDIRLLGGGNEEVISYYLDGHTPKGPAYDVAKRLAKPLTLTFPVTGYAPVGTAVLVNFFNPTPDAYYEPEPEREPGRTRLGGLGRIARGSEGPFGSTMKDSKGNRCVVVDNRLGGIASAYISVGVPGGGEGEAGGALEPGDTITITFLPGPLAAPVVKVIPDDVGYPLHVVRELRNLSVPFEEILEEYDLIIPPGSGISQAATWTGQYSIYPFGELLFVLVDEQPSPWAAWEAIPPGSPAWFKGSYADPLVEPLAEGHTRVGAYPRYYKAVPINVGIYCFASVIAQQEIGEPFEEVEWFHLTANTPISDTVFHLAGAHDKGFQDGNDVDIFPPPFGREGASQGVIVNATPDSFEVVLIEGEPPAKVVKEVTTASIVSLRFPSGSLTGESPLTASIRRSPAELAGFGAYVVTNWTGATGPEGGVWENFLNSINHGNHMEVDYRWYGPATTYRAEGGGDGWLAVKRIEAAPGKPTNTITPEEGTVTTTEEPSERFGIGPKGGLGRVITITVTGGGLADGHSKHSKRTTDNADLYWYFNWLDQNLAVNNPLPGGSIALTSGRDFRGTFAAEIKRLYEEAPGGDVFHNVKKVGPLLAELRIFFEVDGHTPTRWKMWNHEGEDPFLAKFRLGSEEWSGGEVTGDLYEAGVLVGKGVPLVTAGDATAGVEFLLTQAIPEFPVWEWYYFKENPEEEEPSGLEHPGREPFGPLFIIPTQLPTSFNTLTFKWRAEFKLYFPPLEDKEEEEIRVKVEEETGEKRKPGEETREEEREKEAAEEKEEQEAAEKLEKEREEERVVKEEEEEPHVAIDSIVRPNARVPSNKAVGRKVPNPAAEPEEGEFG